MGAQVFTLWQAKFRGQCETVAKVAQKFNINADVCDLYLNYCFCFFFCECDWESFSYLACVTSYFGADKNICQPACSYQLGKSFGGKEKVGEDGMGVYY